MSKKSKQPLLQNPGVVGVLASLLSIVIGPLAAQLKAQAALGIKGKGGALQYFAGGDAVIQLLTAQMVGVAAKTFGTIFQHFRLLFSCMVYAPGRAGDPCKLLCSGFAKQTVMYYNKGY